MESNVKSCYIHIPFCTHICSYCDFCKMYYQEQLVDSYLEALEKEIDLSYQGEVLETIYIGGGTPSSLNMRQLKKLFQLIHKFHFSSSLEFTIECNVENTTSEKLKWFYQNGVNRLSFGVESSQQKYLSFLERKHSFEDVQKTIRIAREIGFSNINVDLMYAFPGETISDVKKDLDSLLSLQVEHISTYSLMIEEHTKLGIQKIKPISEDLDYEMYQMICNILKQHHYEHYEISNFGFKEYYSKHNLCYWDNREYYGFGLGASGYLGDIRYTNTRSFQKYLSGDFILEEEVLSKKDKMEYEIILNLRKCTGISLRLFYQKYGVCLSDVYDYSSLIVSNCLKEEDDFLFIPEEKWYISNEIIVRFLEGEKYE